MILERQDHRRWQHQAQTSVGDEQHADQHGKGAEAEQDLLFNPGYRLTRKERKYRLSKALEDLTGLDFSRKHFKLVA